MLARKIVGMALTLGLTLGLPLAMAGCASNSNDPVVPVEVELFDTSHKQMSGNEEYLNYQVVVKQEVNWDLLPDDRKQAVIDYAFTMSRSHAEENDITAYNIIGIKEAATAEEGNTVLFLYYQGGDEVLIYTTGVITDRWPVPE